MKRTTQVRIKPIRCSECEDFTKLINCDTGEIITYGDYYHDKITEYIDGFVFGLKYAGVEVVSERYKNDTCMNCLGELEGGIRKTIDMMGYGSIFDNFSTKIHLCSRCYEDSPDIWGLDIVDVSSEWGGSPGDFFAYEYEEEIYEYVSNMPIEGKELFWNRLGGGASHFPMNPDEWIDWWCLTNL